MRTRTKTRLTPAASPTRRWLATVALLCAGATAAGAQDEPLALPEEDQVLFLQGFEDRTTELSPYRIAVDIIDPSFFSPDGRVREIKDVALPVGAVNRTVIQFEPRLSAQELAAAIERLRLDVISTIPAIGVVVADISRYRTGLADAPGAFDLSVDGERVFISNVYAALESEPEVRAAFPDMVVGSQQATSSSGSGRQRVAQPNEQTPWGVGNANIDASWPLLQGAELVIGVVDVGFATHEDLALQPAFAGATLDDDDHGNHVAGVACARHNGVGIRGAAPNCTVVAASRPRSGVRLQFAASGHDLKFLLISGYMATVSDLIVDRPDVGVINVSLGYNWGKYYDIDVDTAANQSLKQTIASQGVMFASILHLAMRSDVAIVSSAGNDSRSSSRRNALWSSPFNWASDNVRSTYGWSNALVVEAHDRAFHRAPFSNVGGAISAPGVEVTSLSKERDEYYTDEGTSQAAAYVSAALTIFRALRPDASLRSAIECLQASKQRTDSGAPALDLADALNRCPAS